MHGELDYYGFALRHTGKQGHLHLGAVRWSTEEEAVC